MAQISGSFDANLAAAAGDDGALFQELRQAFLESLVTQVDLIGRARCDGNWRVAAERLRGLGKSFHSEDLTAAADRALESAPGDPVALAKLNVLRDRFVAQLGQ